MGLQTHLPISVFPQTLPGVISSGSHLFIHLIIGQTSIGLSGVLRAGLGSAGVAMFQALWGSPCSGSCRPTILRLHGHSCTWAAGGEAGRSTAWLPLKTQVLSFQNHLLAPSSSSQPQAAQGHSCVLSCLPGDNEKMNLKQQTSCPHRTASPGVQTTEGLFLSAANGGISLRESEAKLPAGEMLFSFGHL